MVDGACKLALDYILAPLTPSEFFSQYYDQRYVRVAHEDPAYWDGLVHEKLLLDPTWAGQLNPRQLEFRSLGQKVDPSQLVNEFGLYDAETLRAEWECGTTFHYVNIEQWDADVAQLNQYLQTTLDAEHSYSNAFVTPGPTQGSLHSIHWDPHDAFIFQLAGEKVWNLYESPYLFTKQYYTNQVEPGPLIDQVVTRAGDFFYTPRGLFHGADTESYSVHLVIGVEVMSVADIVGGLAQVLSEYSRDANKLVPPHAKHDPDQLAENVEATLFALARDWRSLLPQVRYEPKFRVPYV